MYTRINVLERLPELADDLESKHLQLSFLTGAANGALDKTVRVRLGRVNLGILAGVLESLVPAEIYNCSN